jgi:hypothetical protein
MANFFNNSNNNGNGNPFTGAPAQEVTLEARIDAAVASGLTVVTMPWGANPRKKKDGTESKHLLMTQKGPIGFGQYGVFASIRVEGFLTWIPSAGPDGRPQGGEWAYPTAHRRGEEGDEPVPGAAIRGFHKLFLETWKRDLRKQAEEYDRMGKAQLAKQTLMLIKGFDITSVFGTQLNFSLPTTVADLKALKAEGLGLASAQGKAREGRATMVHNVVMAVEFAYQEDGNFGLRVKEVLDWRAPLLTIPSGGGEILSQQAVLEALTAPEEEDESGTLDRMNAKVLALAGKRSKSALKREARARIKKWAATIGVDPKLLEAMVKAKAGAKGVAWGAANVKPTKEEVQQWAESKGEGGGESQAQVETETSVEAGESLLTKPEEDPIDPADIDVEV